jgi:hypothetical protein
LVICSDGVFGTYNRITTDEILGIHSLRAELTLCGRWRIGIVMPAESVNITQLSPSEKIGLMERLWESLSAPDDLGEPPEWHEAVLKGRDSEWQDREAVSQDWEQAKVEIREQSR